MPILPAVITLLGAIITFVALIALHALPTGLSPVSDPVSRYALTRHRAGYWTAAAGAVVAGAGAALLLTALPSGFGVGVVLLWVFVAARALIPFFPMDGPGSTRTRSGRIHNLLAILAFATVTAAAFVAAGSLHDARLDALSTVSTIAGIVMAIGSAGVILGTGVASLRNVFGLAERLIYVGFVGWFAALGVGVLLT